MRWTATHEKPTLTAFPEECAGGDQEAIEEERRRWLGLSATPGRYADGFNKGKSSTGRAQDGIALVGGPPTHSRHDDEPARNSGAGLMRLRSA